MAKLKSTFVCQDCGHNEHKWVGKCPRCNQWNSFIEEEQFNSKKNRPASMQSNPPVKINEIDISAVKRIDTGLKELNRVLGGGGVKGSLTLIGGEPGIGKSTLLLEICGKLSKSTNGKILYASGEESQSQIASRAKRLDIDDSNFYILHETSWNNIEANIKELKPDFLIIDSIQTIYSEEIQSAPGTISQVREVTYELMNMAKEKEITTFVIGHVTKDGQIAGPKILEHMVDTVVYFEGDPTGQYRILRGVKNRFGNTNEVGIFEMGECGLIEVENPSQYFLDDSLKESFGRSLTCIVEGSRPLIIETQALVIENKFGNGRRTTQGFDNSRLSMLLAVIEKYFDIPLVSSDVYINVLGGLKLRGREGDLSVLTSLLSSLNQCSIDDSNAFIGEIGLTGEIRTIGHMESRLRELQNLGYKKAFIPTSVADRMKEKFEIELVGLQKAQDIIKHIF